MCSVRARASASVWNEGKGEGKRDWRGNLKRHVFLPRKTRSLLFILLAKKHQARAQLGRHRQRWLPTERGTSRTVRKEKCVFARVKNYYVEFDAYDRTNDNEQYN